MALSWSSIWVRSWFNFNPWCWDNWVHSKPT